jgi:hypothetical protein
VRRVVEHAALLQRPGGHLLLELGGTQDVLLRSDLERHGFEPPEPRHDGDGDLRGVTTRRARTPSRR